MRGGEGEEDAHAQWRRGGGGGCGIGAERTQGEERRMEERRGRAVDVWTAQQGREQALCHTGSSNLKNFRGIFFFFSTVL